MDRAALTTTLLLISQAFLASGQSLPYDMGSGAALIVVCTILDLQTRVREFSLTDPGANANENYPSGTAGVRQGDSGATTG
jgi:hypothetical protein